MIKIVEAYSDKIIANVQLIISSLQKKIDLNGIEVTAYVNSSREFKVNTSPHKSVDDRELAIVSAKLEAVNKKEVEIIMVIIRHGDKNLLASFRHLEGHDAKLYSLLVNGIPFYEYKRKIDIDKELLGKMNMIFNLVSTIDKSNSSILKKTVDSIISCYTETGLITKKDLRWLNKIFNQYKSEGAYE